MLRLHLLSSVMCGFMPRTYPLGRQNGVSTPQRVGPRNERAGGDWRETDDRRARP
jgi:hypothetical protein